jgi:prevent-host-death family protein
LPELNKKPVLKTIKATDARIHFGDVLKRAFKGEEHFIVEKDGLPIAVIISMSDYERYRQALALENLRELNRELNKEMERRGISEEQLVKDMEKTKQEVFEKQYGKVIRQKTS